MNKDVSQQGFWRQEDSVLETVWVVNGIYIKDFFKDDSKEIQGCNAKGQ
jgi:hypothetical protein